MDPNTDSAIGRTEAMSAGAGRRLRVLRAALAALVVLAACLAGTWWLADRLASGRDRHTVSIARQRRESLRQAFARYVLAAQVLHRELQGRQVENAAVAIRRVQEDHPAVVGILQIRLVDGGGLEIRNIAAEAGPGRWVQAGGASAWGPAFRQAGEHCGRPVGVAPLAGPQRGRIVVLSCPVDSGDPVALGVEISPAGILDEVLAGEQAVSWRTALLMESAAGSLLLVSSGDRAGLDDGSATSAGGAVEGSADLAGVSFRVVTWPVSGGDRFLASPKNVALGGIVLGVLAASATGLAVWQRSILGRVRSRAGNIESIASQLRQAVKVSRETEERFRAAAEGSLDAFYLLQAERDEGGDVIDFRITYVNRRGLDSLHKGADELVGERLCEALPVNRTGGFFEKYKRVFETGESLEEEFPISEPYVKARWLRHQVVPLADGVAITSRDVTEHHRAHEKLSRTMQELRRSNEALEQFAHIASHDLREPLRKISSFGTLLSRELGDSLPSRGRDFLERIQDAAGRMDRMTSALLEYARAGSSDRLLEPVDMRRLAEQVVADLSIAIRDADARVTIGELPEVEGDRDLLYRLLLNLVSNALKFRSPERGLEVEIVGKVRAGRAELKVQDNGVGFSADEARFIFRPFHRLKQAPQVEGTGIGLAICQRIVAWHGGGIEALGRPGEGATFTVCLPAAGGAGG